MRPDLASVAAVQDGLVLRRQAVATGYTERELRTHTAVGGPWLVLRRGVYVERERWDSLEGYDARWALRDRAAHLTADRAHVMSHDSAARAWGLPLLRPAEPLVHLTRPGVTGQRTEHGVKHHLTRLDLDAEPVVDGLPVTGLARTAIDVAREHGTPAGVVACDAVLRRGVRRRDLTAQLDVQRNWPYITRARSAVELADAGAENPGESLARLLVVELGIGTPETQFPVRIGDRVAWCDLRVGCHVFEFDGRLKYLPPERGGVALSAAGDVVWAEKDRQRLVCAEGLGMSRIIWSDFFGAARQRALTRLRAEWDVTVARFGTRLPDRLERDARELRGGRSA